MVKSTKRGKNKKEKDKPPLLRLNINWGLILVLLGCMIFWFLICRIIVLKAMATMHESGKIYEQTMKLRKEHDEHMEEVRIAAFRENNIYVNDYQLKIIKEIISICKEHNFEWKLAVAVAKLETQLGTLVVGKNNLYNIKGYNNTYREYKTTRDSIKNFINLLNTSHYYSGFQKSRKLVDLYNYAEDPLWIPKVKSIMDKL